MRNKCTHISLRFLRRPSVWLISAFWTWRASSWAATAWILLSCLSHLLEFGQVLHHLGLVWRCLLLWIPLLRHHGEAAHAALGLARCLGRTRSCCQKCSLVFLHLKPLRQPPESPMWTVALLVRCEDTGHIALVLVPHLLIGLVGDVSHFARGAKFLFSH